MQLPEPEPNADRRREDRERDEHAKLRSLLNDVHVEHAGEHPVGGLHLNPEPIAAGFRKLIWKRELSPDIGMSAMSLGVERVGSQAAACVVSPRSRSANTCCAVVGDRAHRVQMDEHRPVVRDDDGVRGHAEIRMERDDRSRRIAHA